MRRSIETKTPAPVLLHPHHGLCFAFFEGKGYSPEFTLNMQRFLNFLSANNPSVRMTCSRDPVCSACPNDRDGKCVSQEKVESYDRAVLSLCSLQEGDVLPYSVFVKKVRTQILDAGKRRDVCGNCEWDRICINHVN